MNNESVNNELLDSEEKEAEGIIMLVDDTGKEIPFELLDIVDYSGVRYAVLIPAEEDTDMVSIFRIDDAEKDINTLSPVTNDSTAMAVFNLFKEKNKEFFDFE